MLYIYNKHAIKDSYHNNKKTHTQHKNNDIKRKEKN